VASHVGADTRVIVVGDVHGCLDELQSLLVRVGYDRDADQLLLVGDLVNKGPKSAEVVRFVRESGALCVRGNHDDAALSAFYQWRASGGDMTAIALKYAYVAQLSPDDVAFLEQLPFTLSIPAHNAIVVHAGIVPGVDLREQRPVDLYKMRFLQREGSDQSDAGRWRALEKAKHAAEGSPTPLKWAPLWPGPVHVYFGHAASTGLQVGSHSCDTWGRIIGLTSYVAMVWSSKSHSRLVLILDAATVVSLRLASCRCVVFTEATFICGSQLGKRLGDT
jgi:bis(5'-nucleosyl)-tetraphosphatase (symmetrical)